MTGATVMGFASWLLMTVQLSDQAYIGVNGER